MPTKHVGPQGKALLKEWEGLRTEVYADSGSEPTIGIGHRLTRAERTSGKILLTGQAIKYSGGLTQAQCWTLLHQDLEPVERLVNTAVMRPLTQNQFEALCAFAFNIGNGAFAGSTLLKLLNRGDYSAVPVQLTRWIYDNGQVVEGLTNRRAKEIALWNTPDVEHIP